MPNFEIIESEAQPLEKDPENEKEFLHDSLRVANALVNALEGRIMVLERERQTDKLTGVHNETGFLESVERRKTERSGEFVIMYLDLNKFKRINDDMGHDAGDYVLQEVGKYLQGLTREGDAVARLHGDEFVVIFTGVTEQALRQRFEEEKLAFTVHYEGKEIPVSLSAGFATHAQEENVEDVLRRADAAMYSMKKSRSNE
jgi:diguanylate cyclase (GGDEF)-like protein